MQIVETQDFFYIEALNTQSAKLAWAEVRDAILLTDWPHGSGQFIIYPQSGKKRGEGNGVKPIKHPCIHSLRLAGWITENLPELIGAQILDTGDLDAVKTTIDGYFALEWETGNISSSHRAINKLMLTMFETNTVGCFFIVPSSNLAQYLTDRTGNIRELRPYFALYKRIIGIKGFLRIVVIEHDGESYDVPRIPKGTDGRAAG